MREGLWVESRSYATRVAEENRVFAMRWPRMRRRTAERGSVRRARAQSVDW